MPLIDSPSKEALSANIRTEIDHGKPQKQAVAIGLSVQRRALQKCHADALAAKAGAYYKAKSLPRNFCKAPEDVEEGRELLKCYDDAVADGADPEEASSLIVKCAGAMGGPMSGPLAATLATRPVKKLADGTVMDSSRPMLKSYVHTHQRTINGKIITVGAYNNKVLAGPKHPKGTVDHAVEDSNEALAEAKPYLEDIDLSGEDPSVRATIAKDAIHALQNYLTVMEHHHQPAESWEVGVDFSTGIDKIKDELSQWQAIHDSAVEQMHTPDKLQGGPLKGSGHFIKENGKAKYVPGEAPEGANLASIGHQVSLGENKTKGWYLRATNASHASVIREAYKNVTGQDAPEAQKIGASNHFGKEGSFPHVFFGPGEDAKKLAIKVLAEVHKMYPAQKGPEGEPAPEPEKAAEPETPKKSPYEMGKEAHAKGLPGAPAANKEFMDAHVKPGAEVGSNSQAMKDYAKGWNAGNIDAPLPEEDEGPKEGDQKDGLTFHDGRWHNDKEEEHGPVMGLTAQHQVTDPSGKVWDVVKASPTFGDVTLEGPEGEKKVTTQAEMAKNGWRKYEPIPESEDGAEMAQAVPTSMPTEAELVGVGNEWIKEDKHRIYFQPLKFKPGTGATTFKSSKVWYDFKDKEFHTKDIPNGADKIIEAIKAKAKEWGTQNTQEIPDATAAPAPEAPEAKDESRQDVTYLDPSGNWSWMHNLKWMAENEGHMVGKSVQARWTNSGHQYSALAKVTKENKGSFQVELQHGVSENIGKYGDAGNGEAYPKGQKITVPNMLKGATWGNGIFALPDEREKFVKANPDMDKWLKGTANHHAPAPAEAKAPEAAPKPVASQWVKDYSENLKKATAREGGAHPTSQGMTASDLSEFLAQDAEKVGGAYGEAAKKASDSSQGASEATSKAHSGPTLEEPHKAAAYAHAKAGLQHMALAGKIHGDDGHESYQGPVAPDHLKDFHAQLAKAHAKLSQHHTEMAENHAKHKAEMEAKEKGQQEMVKQMAANPVQPEPKAPKPGYQEHNWEKVVQAASTHKVHGDIENPEHTKEELKDYAAKAKHAALVAIHKHEAGHPTPKDWSGDQTWEGAAYNWAKSAKKAEALAKKG
jgi:hypothetical protein